MKKKHYREAMEAIERLDRVNDWYERKLRREEDEERRQKKDEERRQTRRDGLKKWSMGRMDLNEC